MVSFLYPKTWLLYVASGVLGAGAALIWTGQGNYLSLCSNESNIARNSGVFWAMLQARFVYMLPFFCVVVLNERQRFFFIF